MNNGLDDSKIVTTSTIKPDLNIVICRKRFMSSRDSILSSNQCQSQLPGGLQTIKNDGNRVPS